MKKIRAITFFLLSVVIVSTARAESQNVDWKAYGAATTNKHNSLCFYDAKGIVYTDTHVRVWTKCLAQEDMDNIDIKKDANGKVLNDSAKKIARYYMPPIATIEDGLNADQIMSFIMYEQIADSDIFPPEARIFYELDCPNKKARELNINIQTKDKSGSTDVPRDWKYIAPETNVDRLSILVCQSPQSN